MYIFGSGVAAFFHQQPTSSDWYKYKWPILIAEALFAVNAVVMCALSRFFWKKHRFVVRAMAFAFPYIGAVSPFVYRLKVCVTTGSECIPETLYLHLSTFIATLFVLFFFVTKIPERFAPGNFDIIGQSHQLFHISAAILTTIQMYMLPIDADLRKETLTQIQQLSPNIFSTFLLFAIVQVLGLLVVSVFGVLVVKRVLISNKKDVVQDVIRKEKKKES